MEKHNVFNNDDNSRINSEENGHPNLSCFITFKNLTGSNKFNSILGNLVVIISSLYFQNKILYRASLYIRCVDYNFHLRQGRS